MYRLIIRFDVHNSVQVLLLVHHLLNRTILSLVAAQDRVILRKPGRLPGVPQQTHLAVVYGCFPHTHRALTQADLTRIIH